MTVYPYGQDDYTEDSLSDICGFPMILGQLTKAITYGAFAFGFVGGFFS